MRLTDTAPDMRLIIAAPATRLAVLVTIATPRKIIRARESGRRDEFVCDTNASTC